MPSEGRGILSPVRLPVPPLRQVFGSFEFTAGWRQTHCSERAARADRDAQPLTEADLKRMRRTPQAKIIRRALELTQEEFAARYHIPLGTLRDWEQGRAEPDQPTRAFLTLIARDPERVNLLLNTHPH
jgi:putative transcriptional regulator